MLQADPQVTWVLLNAARQAVGDVYGGAKAAQGLLTRALVRKQIRWQYCTEQDPEPRQGRPGFWEHSPNIDWDGNRAQQLPRAERHVPQPGPPGQNKVKTYHAVPGGPPLYLVKLAWEDVVAALPLLIAISAIPGETQSAPVGEADQEAAREESQEAARELSQRVAVSSLTSKQKETIRRLRLVRPDEVPGTDTVVLPLRISTSLGTINKELKDKREAHVNRSMFDRLRGVKK